ncbi:ZC21A protein, partial [Nyctiprogne leucopyga]|nr:ZC21A protein [Nyctiprogne leucopyga]
PEPPKKPSNWRRKHEEFIATIRAAKGLNLKDGGKLPPPPPPSYDPVFVKKAEFLLCKSSESNSRLFLNWTKVHDYRTTDSNIWLIRGLEEFRHIKYKPAAVKKMPSVGSMPPSSSSRLPQPSGVSKTVVGM